MGKKSTTIRFPGNRLDSSASRHEHANESDDFEDWEILDELREKEDYPVILRMSKDILEECYESLKAKRKPRSVDEIYEQFVMEGYLLFTEEDLLKALLRVSRLHRQFESLSGEPLDT